MVKYDNPFVHEDDLEGRRTPPPRSEEASGNVVTDLVKRFKMSPQFVLGILRRHDWHGGKAENELKWHQENSGGGSAGETFFAGSHLLRMKIKYLLEIVLAPFNCGPNAPRSTFDFNCLCFAQVLCCLSVVAILCTVPPTVKYMSALKKKEVAGNPVMQDKLELNRPMPGTENHDLDRNSLMPLQHARHTPLQRYSKDATMLLLQTTLERIERKVSIEMLYEEVERRHRTETLDVDPHHARTETLHDGPHRTRTEVLAEEAPNPDAAPNVDAPATPTTESPGWAGPPPVAPPVYHRGQSDISMAPVGPHKPAWAMDDPNWRPAPGEEYLPDDFWPLPPGDPLKNLI